MRKLLILLIKYLPLIQMFAMLGNNTAYCFDVYNDVVSYNLDFIFGNSIVAIFLMYVASYVFKFCLWHRILITANLANIAIAHVDACFRLPVEDVELLTLYYAVAIIFICIAIHNHINHDPKDKSITQSSSKHHR